MQGQAAREHSLEINQYDLDSLATQHLAAHAQDIQCFRHSAVCSFLTHPIMAVQ